MKVKLILLCLLLPYLLPAQITYNHYLDTTCVWYERFHAIGFPDQDCISGFESTDRTRMHVVGWDSVDGEAWHVLHHDQVSTRECQGQLIHTYDYEWTVRIREDSSGRIWLKSSAQPGVVLYDFRPDLQVADTLWMNNYYEPCAIENIDTVYLGTSPRKRYWCECMSSDEDFVIEGVGFCRGFDFTWGLCGIPDINPRMICFQKNNQILIVDTIVTCDPPPHITVGIGENRLSDQWQGYWRTADESIVFSEIPTGGHLEWALFDPQGRLIRTGLLDGHQIPLPNLSSGLYLFVGRNDFGQFVKRFVR